MNITIPLEWKQSDIEMVAKARAWAVKAHAGQKDKAGKDYFKAHVTVVAEGVKGDPIAEAVAFCAACGRTINEHNAYTSAAIQNDIGIGYLICKSCYEHELEIRKAVK